MSFTEFKNALLEYFSDPNTVIQLQNEFNTIKQEEKEAMFSGAALDKECPITAMYMETKVNNTSIKLILDSGSTRSIVMLQLVNQLDFKVDYAVMF
ncbi:hypothetical protein G9A89_020353 [Geosiphon pyriformis]|nr:hypothetical protein G9A89_020353 [Geosiphon pyriformis]